MCHLTLSQACMDLCHVNFKKILVGKPNFLVIASVTAVATNLFQGLKDLLRTIQHTYSFLTVERV